MATGTARSSDSQAQAKNLARDAAQRERFIQSRIDRTRRSVKWRDLLTSALLGLSVTLAFLLLLIGWDHWVAPLNTWNRSAALLLMLGYWAYVVVRHLSPLILNRINPVFAARTIEETVPELKNSLTNYLLLRSQHAEIKPVVFDAVGQQAAHDLSGLQLETAVDRARLIRVGYFFAALIVLGGLYSILSPKDPWQTVQRVVLPWADIARPSRVEIVEVRIDGELYESGDAVPIYLGQQARVTAVVRGVERSEEVVLSYTTADNQVVDRLVPMVAEANTASYSANVPDESRGLQRDVVFRIEAGDTVSSDYYLKLLSVPHLVIDSITYDYPEYTRMEKRVVRGQGSIRAVEGTRVTIQATANQEIDNAYLKFAVNTVDPESSSQHDSAADHVRMRVNGSKAEGSFRLTLPDEQREVFRRSYEIRFTSKSGQANERPLRYLIDVVPDLRPEIEFLAPPQQEIELPVDRQQVVEILARDPDFGLVDVTLHMVAGGEPILSKQLLDEPKGWTGSANRRFEFDPQTYDLQPGHMVTYWATAQDNYPGSVVSHGESKQQVNSTSKYRFVIVAPENKGTQRQEGSDGSDSKDQAEFTEKPAQAEDGSEEDDGQSATDGEMDEASDGSPSDEQQESPGDSQSVTEDDQQEGAGIGQQTDEESSHEGENGSAGPGDANDTQQNGSGQEGAGSGDGPSSENSSENGSGGKGSRRRATDGTEDSEIFDRVLERMRESENHDGNSGEPATDEMPDSGQSESTSEAGSSSEQTPNDGSATNAETDGNHRQSERTGEDGGNQGEAEEGEDNAGEGGRTEDAAQPEEAISRQTEPNSGDPPAQPGLGDDGESGFGARSDDQHGAPADQETNQQQPKHSPSNNQGPESPTEAKSPGTDKQQSDSEGGEGGDRSGGGKQGGSQSATQPGNDSAGSSSTADDGAGASQESGNGEANSQAGDDSLSSEKTGQSGKEHGSGTAGGDPQSNGSEAESSDVPNGQPGGSLDSQPATDGADSQQDAAPGQIPTNGGRPGERSNPSPPSDVNQGVPPAGDAANTEYAEKATDLALRYLKDQQDNPDRALLDDLGWTADELRQFIERWDRLKQQSAQDPTAQSELLERLESLGLQSPNNRLRRDNVKHDPHGGLNDTANRSRPPTEYLDQLRAFQESIAKDRE